MAKESAGRNEVVTRVVVYYRRPGDAEERSFTLENTAGGAAIDGVCWNNALVKRLAYKENGRYVEPKKERGRDWRISGTVPEAGGTGDAPQLSAATAETTSLVDDPSPECIWVHALNCTWYENCPT